MGRHNILSGLFIIILGSGLLAQGEDDLRVFGYFQTSFQHVSSDVSRDENTFNLQQLNLFFQKNISTHWSAFVNFEILNNYSSSRHWGALNLEEAWVKYRYNKSFTLKLGLSVPAFNYLNEIKNRTPLLPYIIRPLIYETSFGEFLALEEFVPARAFVQAYGFFPVGGAKLDYALYLGNSPNINNNSERGQTGVDTTATVLVGGRVGIRLTDGQAGISATYDRTNMFRDALLHSNIAFLLASRSPDDFQERPRFRLGADLSYLWNKIYLESEYVSVVYDDGWEELEADRQFYYFTLGYHLSERLFIYGGYWESQEEYTIVEEISSSVFGDDIEFTTGEFDIRVPVGGLSYRLNDRITLKAQYARPLLKSNTPQFLINDTENFYSLAASVFL